MVRLLRLPPAAAALAALAMAGCAPALRPPPAASSLAPPLQWRTNLPGTAVVEADWWRAFGDSALVALVERARANNTDVRIAAARIDEARGTEAASRSLLLPTLDAGLSGGAQRQVSAFGRGRRRLPPSRCSGPRTNSTCSAATGRASTRRVPAPARRRRRARRRC